MRSDLDQHRLVERRHGRQGGLAQGRTETENGADCMHEADPQRVLDLGGGRRFQHQGPDHVQGRQPRRDLFANPVGTLTPQYVRRKRDLDLAKERLNLPRKMRIKM
jgi:hypothetical protein